MSDSSRATSPPAEAPSRAHLVWSAVRLIGTILLLAFAVRHVTKIEHSLPDLRQLHGGWLVASLVVAAASVFGWWLRWMLFLQLAGVKATPMETLRLTWMADFFNYFIFGALAADGFRIAMLSRRYPQQIGAVAASVVFDHMAGLLSSAVFFAAFTLPKKDWIIATGGPAMSGCLWSSGLLLGTLALLTFSGVMAVKIHKNWIAHFTRRWPRVSAHAEKTLNQLRQLASRLDLALLGLIASLLCLAASYAAFAAAARAWGSAIPWQTVFAALPIVDALSALPVSVQGLGIREQIFLALFPSSNTTDHAQVLAISLTGFAVQSVWALLGGLWLAIESVPVFSRRATSANLSS